MTALFAANPSCKNRHLHENRSIETAANSSRTSLIAVAHTRIHKFDTRKFIGHRIDVAEPLMGRYRVAIGLAYGLFYVIPLSSPTHR